MNGCSVERCLECPRTKCYSVWWQEKVPAHRYTRSATFAEAVGNYYSLRALLCIRYAKQAGMLGIAGSSEYAQTVRDMWVVLWAQHVRQAAQRGRQELSVPNAV